MFQRLRSTWLAGGGAVLLVLSITGMAAAAGLASDTTTVVSDEVAPAVSPTLLTFEDVNGDGIDDDCAVSPVTEDAPAAAAAFLLIDTNADGKISTTEAAHSDWVGGKNCNHGGFVSWVAHNKAEGTEGAKTAKDHTAKDALKADKAAKADKVKPAHGKATKIKADGGE